MAFRKSKKYRNTRRLFSKSSKSRKSSQYPRNINIKFKNIIIFLLLSLLILIVIYQPSEHRKHFITNDFNNIFDNIYKTQKWGKGNINSSSSGYESFENLQVPEEVEIEKFELNNKWIENEIWGNTDLNPKNIFFVQIGSNCGTTECAVCGEPIWKDCKKNNWSGIVVEPMPNIYNKLKQNYSYNSNVKAINCAVSDKDGFSTFYGIDSKAGEASSLSLSHAQKHGISMAKNPTKYREFNVKTYKLETFWNKFIKGGNVDILNLDCEGYDHIIILSTDFSKLNPMPKYILYEAFHIPNRNAVLEHLKKYNYHFFKDVRGCGGKDFDTLVKLKIH